MRDNAEIAILAGGGFWILQELMPPPTLATEISDALATF